MNTGDLAFDAQTLRQRRRVLSCYLRLEQWAKDLTVQSLETGSLDLTTVPEYYDLDVTTFFLHCFNLSGYLREFDECEAVAFMKGDTALKRRRDIVIPLKHAVMVSQRWSDGGSSADLQVTRINSLVLPDDGVTPSILDTRAGFAYRFADGAALDLHRLAEKCVESWITFGLPKESRSTPPKEGPGAGRAGDSTAPDLY